MSTEWYSVEGDTSSSPMKSRRVLSGVKGGVLVFYDIAPVGDLSTVCVNLNLSKAQSIIEVKPEALLRGLALDDQY